MLRARHIYLLSMVVSPSNNEVIHINLTFRGQCGSLDNFGHNLGRQIQEFRELGQLSDMDVNELKALLFQTWIARE